MVVTSFTYTCLFHWTQFCSEVGTFPKHGQRRPSLMLPGPGHPQRIELKTPQAVAESEPIATIPLISQRVMEFLMQTPDSRKVQIPGRARISNESRVMQGPKALQVSEALRYQADHFRRLRPLSIWSSLLATILYLMGGEELIAQNWGCTQTSIRREKRWL